MVETENRASTHICATHCPYCSLQCGMTLRAVPPDAWIVTERDFPTNRGGLCQKGWTAAELLAHPDRLLSPLIRDRRGGVLRPVRWADALDRIASEIGRVQE